MSDVPLPDRLTQLRSRWEADPASRIFLQLAEEYRHLGRLHEALAVLEAGLKEHPGYLSALVAKGRCLLELGHAEPAREVLERVVRQDATQAVANKLLVRAYLDTGQADRARERLDLYSLLHDGDPEIEELRGRIRRLGTGSGAEPPRPPRQAASPLQGGDALDETAPDLALSSVVSAGAEAAGSAGSSGSAKTAVPAIPAGRAADPFPDPPSTPPARPAAARSVAPPSGEERDVFDLELTPIPRRAAVQDVFELEYPVVAAPAAATPAPTEPEPPAALDEPEPTSEGEPFSGLVSRAVRARYLSGLAAEGLFPVDLAPAPPPPAPPAPPTPSPIHQPGEIFPLRSIGEAVEAELRRSTVEPAPEAPAAALPEIPELLAAPVAPETPEIPETPQTPEITESATVTLGNLYLRQGHLEEAERIFSDILRREPGNLAVHEGLARIAASRREATAKPAALDALGETGEAEGMGGSPRARKVQLLNNYLQRIRRGSQPDVP
jgi:tetratricopeptide (TPR) repeat protein